MEVVYALSSCVGRQYFSVLFTVRVYLFPYSAPKRVGGTAVASQLYRTSSFSSGRSSVADQEDMYSDASLEDDVLDLNHKVSEST